MKLIDSKQTLNSKELFETLYNTLLPISGEQESRCAARIVMEELYGAKYPFSDSIVEVKQESIDNLLTDLQNERPIQYIIGHTYFYDLKFRVTADVLIPRGETEELVDWIVKDCKGRANLRIIDIGTGSGAIAVSLALNIENAEVTALDISTAALSVARQNSENLGADVKFEHKDILNSTLENKYDIIVSNPPYVTRREMGLMCNNVLNYEPHTALFVEDDNPLIFYRRIAELALESLHEGGALYFEINEGYGEQCCDMLKDIGFKGFELRKDLNDKNRMIKTW